jgi:hypothetical protein
MRFRRNTSAPAAPVQSRRSSSGLAEGPPVNAESPTVGTVMWARSRAVRVRFAAARAIAIGVGALLLSAASASAAPSHVFTTDFGTASSTPANPYPLAGPTDIEVDQTSHDIYATDPGTNERQTITIGATGGTYALTFKGQTTAAISYNASDSEVRTALEAISTVGAGNITGPVYGYEEEPGVVPITFVNGLSRTDVDQMTIDTLGLTGGTATIATTVAGAGGSAIEKFAPSGEFILMFGKEVNKTAVEESATRAAEENVCPAVGHPGDICRSGTSASSAGAFEIPDRITVDNSCYQHEPPLTAATTPTCREFDPSAGDVYVADTGDNLVSKFDSSGHLVSTWGSDGQKNGSESSTTFDGFQGFGVAANSYLYVLDRGLGLWRYTQAGTYIPPIEPLRGARTNIDEGVALGLGFAFDPSDGELYQVVKTENPLTEPEAINHYGTNCLPCEPNDTFGTGDLSTGGGEGIAVDGASHTVYVADSIGNDIAVFGDARPIVTTDQPTGATESEVTLTGRIEPAGRGNITSCYFEYGFDKSYGSTVPCTPDPSKEHPFEGPTEVTATLTGFSPGTQDHYRLVASNATGAAAAGADQTFITTQPPAIDGLVSSNLTATSADLSAQVNPNGLDTTYHFEYGPTTDYGQSSPVPNGTITASNSDRFIEVHLSGLIPNVVYHYTLVAENADGTTIGEDHIFNFYPPSCPNENVRQQTQANYLPDCRAYELVSPEDAAGTRLYAGGPNTGYATSPSRFSFVGLYSTIPNSGGSPIDGAGDLYVSTRTDTGWVTRYVGLPSNEVAVDGGPPMGPPVSAGVVGAGLTGTQGTQIGRTNESNRGSYNTDELQNYVLADPAMDTFVDWNDGSLDSSGASNAPYVWGADGGFLERWPTNLATVPSGSYLGSGGSPTAPGVHALDCPTGPRASNNCPGDVTASSDLSHFVFATEWSPFALGGQVTPPGSVYDNDTATGTVEIASRLAGGAPIPAVPTDEAGDPLQIPAVSADGTHILIAAAGTGPCGSANCEPEAPCGAAVRAALRCQMQPSQLYMRVDEVATYEIAPGHEVTYVGMTSNGSKVYFTSAEQLTSDDHDTSTDLYMWSEAGEKAGHPLTLISKGNNEGNPGEPGNSDACNASYTAQCGIVTYSDVSYCTLLGGAGGNCKSDNSIAGENGDIYFFSPEQLDGSRGLPNKENLYDYRNGSVQYVATFTSGPFCYHSPVPGLSDSACSDTPVVRMQVSPDDSHMAFVTASPVTQYNNAGHLEMYTYDPSTRKIVCVSCNPSGAPPTSDVEASQDGLFMANDGRAFFSTEEALVHGDTNQGEDVYEYVDGSPQLITPGTGDTGAQGGSEKLNVKSTPGLIGVSASGSDVYFSTTETLVPQDHNGHFIKFYDARSGGGFSAPPPPPSCEAAEECHGSGSEPAAALKNGTGTVLGAGGNVAPQTSARRHKRHRKRSRRRHHTRAAMHGGGGAK